jgi:hypothetical protein
MRLSKVYLLRKNTIDFIGRRAAMLSFYFKNKNGRM